MTDVLGNAERGTPFVVSAPAGTGKNTLVDMLIQEFPSCVKESVSCTTRPQRDSEKDGEHYHFMTTEKFEEKIAQGAFAEYAKVFGNYYGTQEAFVQQELDKGCHVILVIDVQGALRLWEKKFPGVFVFIKPPSYNILQQRLLQRGTESQETITERLKVAKSELAAAKNYDYTIVNDNLEHAYDVLRSIVIAEEHKNVGITE